MRVSFSKLSSYQKLRHQVIFQDDNDHHEAIRRASLPPLLPRRSWFTRVIRPRPRRLKIKIKGLRKLFKFKRVKVGKLSWAKLVKRFKDSQAHFGDLFAGNYMFMQVTPTSFNKKPYLAPHNDHYLNYLVNNNKFPGLPSSRFDNYALQKVV